MQQESDKLNKSLFALSVEAFEGTLSGESWKQLEALLAANTAACAQWQVYMQFHSDLRTLSIISRAERSVHNLVMQGRDLWDSSPLADEPPAKPQIPDRSRSASLPLAGWVATLAAAVAIAVGIQWQLGSEPSTPASTANPNGYPTLALGPLQLPEGTACYYLPGVGDLSLEGPADLQLVDAKNLRLDRGHIRVHVREPSGYGFKVATSQGVVTDLGTEFAVDASEDDSVNMVVLDGAVELATPQPGGPPAVERFEAGEGISLSPQGERSRIMQIVAGLVPTFRRSGDVPQGGPSPVLLGVTDNLPVAATKQFYEVVEGGFREDAKAYVDRNYEWNGLTTAGLPSFLQEADYIKTFNDLKRHDLEITLELAGPCQVAVLWDERAPYPQWLLEQFEKTSEMVGLDEGPFPRKSDPAAKEFGIGPGNSIDREFSIWIQQVPGPGKVVLGPLGNPPFPVSMYGIAVAH